MLKAELHIHTNEDPIHKNFIKYSAKQLIDQAHQQNFDVLAFTCHDKVIHSQELEDYAKSKNILLIPGVERSIKGKDVLIYNLTNQEAQQIHSLRDLQQLKQHKEQTHQPFLVVAAHPFFYGPTCLKNKVLQHFNLFHAWEYSFFYTKYINRNRKALHLAKKYRKPVLANSDLHHPQFLGQTYSLIRAEKDLPSVFQAIKNNHLTIKTTPLSFLTFGFIFLLAAFSGLYKLIRQ